MIFNANQSAGVDCWADAKPLYQACTNITSKLQMQEEQSLNSALAITERH